MASGTIKWFNANKGYGFIAPNEGNRDIFIHVTELEKAGINHLNEGQKVSYEIITKNNKQSATNLELVD